MSTKHPDRVIGFEGSLEDLAKSIGNMQYNKVEEFVTFLADDITRQANADRQKDRKQLAERLYKTAEKLYEVRDEIRKVWKICRPYMKEKE